MTNTEPPAPPALPDGGSGAGGMRSITRRTGLPTGRAVVGALLVTLSVIGLFLAYQSSQEGPETRYLVVRQDIVAGERLTRDDVALQVMELSAQLAERTFTEAQLDQVLGSVAAIDLFPGSLIQEASVFALAEGEDVDAPPIWELALRVDGDNALVSTLRVGERVAVVGTTDFDIDEDPFTCTFVAAEDMRVIKIERSGEGSLTADGGKVLMLLGTEDPESVMWTIFADDRVSTHLVRTSKAQGESLTGLNTCGLDPRDARLYTGQLADLLDILTDDPDNDRNGAGDDGSEG